MEDGAPTPWYESNLLWGPVAIALSIILTVVAAKLRDVRWLLWIAAPPFTFGFWAICRPLTSRLLRRSLVALAGVIVCCSLFLLYRYLPRPDISTNQPPTQSHPLPLRAPEPAPPKTYPSRKERKETTAARDHAKPATPAVAPSVGTINQGPCGVIQVGGTQNTATGGNCTPIPFRTLTDTQRQGIKIFLAGIPSSVLVSVGGILGSSDASTYALDFFPLFDGRHLDSQTSPSVRTGFPTTFTDVFVASVTEDDIAVPYRDAFVDALNHLGVKARKANGSKLGTGNLEVLVGFRPEEVTPR